MTSCSATRRARPLLGTLVDVRIEGAPELIERAFAAIAKVHRLMSSHEPTSDVSRINGARPGELVTVHSWTKRVLARARRLFDATSGLFDCCVAPVLHRAGQLPRPVGAVCADPRASFADLELLEGAVRPRRALNLTLDGIAKGFAVDQAVRALRRVGVGAGVVNAGGDLRIFGPRPEPLHLRHPDRPAQLVYAGEFRDVAVATSASYFSARTRRGAVVSPIIDPVTGASCQWTGSVSVIAADCMSADALTKIVLLDPRGCAKVLEAFAARVIVLPTSAAA